MSTPSFQDCMREATRLTQAGDLRAATELIQRALAGRGAVPPAADRGDVIDVEAREIVEPSAGQRPALPDPSPSRQPAPPLRPPQASPASPGAPSPPRGAAAAPRLLRGQHSAAGLTRDWRLFVPPRDATRPLSLLLMLHGCTQDGDDFATGTGMDALAAEHGFAVLYPTQSSRANPNGCWNWFKHSHQARGRGEPAFLASLAAQVAGRHGVDPRRVYVAGLSAGGAMAALLGEAYPESFAAIGVHSGIPRGAARDLPGALQTMNQGPAAPPPPGRLPTIVFHGDADSTVHPRNGAALAAARGGANAAATVEKGRSAGGRAWTRSVWRDAEGRAVAEHWLVHGAGHAWSGGRAPGSYVDPAGPDASREMLRFFAANPRTDGG